MISNVSLSSYLLTAMAESSVWTPGRVELRADDQSEVTKVTLDNVTWRSSLSYHLHHLSSRVARLVASIAIYSVVSPLGLLYHSAHLLCASDSTLRDKHWKCLTAEYVRCVCVAFIVGGSIACAVRGVNPLTVGAVCFPGMIGGCLEISSNWKNPFLNSRRIDAPQDDKNRIAYAILKWNVGLIRAGEPSIDYCKLLSKYINESAVQILQQIQTLQKTLPDGHQLPVPLSKQSFDVVLLLNYLEESRKVLPEEIWNKIIPIREKLIHYHKIFNNLQQDNCLETGVTFQWKMERIQDAFALPNGSKVSRQLPLQHYVYSLTQTLFIKMFSSNWLYPSNYKPREIEDKGSIARSTAGMDLCEGREEIQGSFNHYVKKPLRWVARALCSTVIIAVGAPLGAFMHGAQAVYHLGISFFVRTGKDYYREYLAKLYAYAAWDDFCTFVMGWRYSDPVWDLHLIARRENRAGLALALILKNNFGVSGRDGELLAYSIVEDVQKEKEWNHELLDAFEARSKQVLRARLEEYEKLETAEQKTQLNEDFKSFSVNGTGPCRDQNLVDLRFALMAVRKVTDWGASSGVHSGQFPYVLKGFDDFAHYLAADDKDVIHVNMSSLRILKGSSTEKKSPSKAYDTLKARIFSEDATLRSIFNFGTNEQLSRRAVTEKCFQYIEICNSVMKDAEFTGEAKAIAKWMFDTQRAINSHYGKYSSALF